MKRRRRFSFTLSLCAVVGLLTLLFLSEVREGSCGNKRGKKGSDSNKPGVSTPPESSNIQYYYRGGFKRRECSPTTPVQLQSFSQYPRIAVRYDGRYFNNSFVTLRKSSVMENVLHISCVAKFPITLLPNPLTMKKDQEKLLIKTFEDNMETQCNSEMSPKSPCTNYTVSTYIPVHLLHLTIDTECQSFCRQVLQATQLKVTDAKGIIYGNISWSRIPTPDVKKERNGTGVVDIGSGISAQDDDSNNLVQIFVSPVGTSGKSWIIKCSTDSDLTAKGATLLMKLENEVDPFLIKETKEYRKAGIHTIRATFNLPTEDVDYVHCLFPRLNDFPWISRHTSIHFHDPISYWECILRLCGAFVCTFILFSVICIVIHKWLHSECCAKRALSSTTSQSQLSLRYSQKSLTSQRSIESRFPIVERDTAEAGGSGEWASGRGGKKLVRMDTLSEADSPPHTHFMEDDNDEGDFDYDYNYELEENIMSGADDANDSIKVAQLPPGTISSCHL